MAATMACHTTVMIFFHTEVFEVVVSVEVVSVSVVSGSTLSSHIGVQEGLGPEADPGADHPEGLNIS